jgi:hypothetical protein
VILILPTCQIVIVPCGITVRLSDADRKKLYDECKALSDALEAADMRVYVDYRDCYSPGWKFNHWELKVNAAANFHRATPMQESCDIDRRIVSPG